MLDDHYDFAVEPGEEVTAIGYRLGQPEFSLFPQWIACELVTPIDQEFDGLPMFLVRGDTEKGSSGSPVIAYREDASKLRHADGRRLTAADWASRFLGIYSGRLRQGRDLGIVWSIACVRAVVENACSVLDAGEE
jgi:hypothetical protein